MLLDSNSVIYSTQPAHGYLRSFILANAPSVSAITVVEVLGYHRLTVKDRKELEDFFKNTRVIPIDDRIISGAVRLRQRRKMALADAIIAATALEHNLPLVTRNVNDYKSISGLRIINPFATP